MHFIISCRYLSETHMIDKLKAFFLFAEMHADLKRVINWFIAVQAYTEEYSAFCQGF